MDKEPDEVIAVAKAISDCYAVKADWRLRLRQAAAAIEALKALGWDRIAPRPAPAAHVLEGRQETKMAHLHHKAHHSKKGERLPHLADAAHPDTGKVDMEKLKAGQAAWQAAIDAGDYELVSATEVGIDDKTDVLILTRRKTH